MVQKQSQMAGCAYKYWNDIPAMEYILLETTSGQNTGMYPGTALLSGTPAETNATKLEVPNAPIRDR
ncbi:MAG TPA: hypothetical protein VEY06_05915 [Flavisolibacter sp.]|nr:hypothetical protein [Flavisolibacter sp.]